MEERPLDGAHLALGPRFSRVEVGGERDDSDGARAGAAQRARSVAVDGTEEGEFGRLEAAEVHLEALERRVGIALGACVLAARGEWLEVDGHACEPAAGSRFAQRKEIGALMVEEREQIDALRVAEAGVEFDEHDTLGREHVATVEDATVELAELATQRAHARSIDCARFIERLLREERQQVILARVRAHAPRVGPLVALVRALVVLHGGHVRERLAVGERENRKLLATQSLAQHEVWKALLTVRKRLVN